MLATFWHNITSPLVAVVGLTGLFGVGCIIVGLLAPAWLQITRQNLIWFGVVLIAGGAFYWWAFRAGERHMAQRIAIKDQAAIERVNEATKEVETCIQSGGQWDDVTGSCASR